MTESVGRPSLPSRTGNLRGTQPLQNPAAAQDASRLANRSPRGSEIEAQIQALRDQTAVLNGSARVAAYAQRTEAIADLKFQAEMLMIQMDPIDRIVAQNMLDSMMGQLENGPVNETLDQFRDRLKGMLAKFQEMVEAKQQTQRAVRADLDAQWRIFYESLERYLNNLKNMEKLETSFQDQRDRETKSQAKFTERLLSAAAALAPEQRFSLLTARLTQKPN